MLARLLFASVLAATPLAAQSTSAVSGTVYDSLLGAPLAGALVWIEGHPATATTDARGAFRLDGVPSGRQIVNFSHPSLDSLGMPGTPRPVNIGAGREARLTLGVPSLETFHRALCRGGPVLPGASLPDIIFGTVLDADRSRRVAAADVVGSWLVVSPPGVAVAVDRRSLETTSDSIGEYRLCGAPPRLTVSVVAAAGPVLTGSIDVPAGPRPIRRQDLYVSLDTAARDTSGNQAGRAVVLGRILTENDDAIPGADAYLEGTAAAARADQQGRYVLSGLPAGSQVLMTRSVGYGALRQTVRLRDGDTLRLTTKLKRVTVLDTIRVVGHGSAELDELLERLQRRTGFTMMGDRLKGAGNMPSLLASVPRMRMLGNQNMGCAPQPRGAPPATSETAGCFTLVSGPNNACRAHVWVDGFSSSEQELGTIRPADVMAVEWYADPALVPGRYQDRDGCGVLLVWTTALRAAGRQPAAR